MPTHRWRLVRSGAGSAAWNMAVDEALLRGRDGRPVLRLYAWRPAALSLGYFQPLGPFLATARRAGLALVRRPTGGGAIHHDRELTFALIARAGCDGYPAETRHAYERVHAVVQAALAGLGAAVAVRGGDAALAVQPRAATLCFDDATALDLVDGQGRKVVGSAQRRVGERVLHHGSIPLEVPSLTPEAGSVRLAAGRAVGWDELADALVQQFSKDLDAELVVADLTPDEHRLATALSSERYADPARGVGPTRDCGTMRSDGELRVP